MGKNLFGGKNGKRGPNSNSNSNINGRNKLRVAEEDGEEYAIVTKMVGNGCFVHCADNIKRLCIIRGKFQGKGKSMNIISNGTWVLVGRRDWESVNKTAMPKCDLLEVYSHVDKERLKTSTVDTNWAILADNDVTNMDKISGATTPVVDIHFRNEKEEEYLKTMEMALKTPNEKIGVVGLENNAIVDKVYVEDI